MEFFPAAPTKGCQDGKRGACSNFRGILANILINSKRFVFVTGYLSKGNSDYDVCLDTAARFCLFHIIWCNPVTW